MEHEDKGQADTDNRRRGASEDHHGTGHDNQEPPPRITHSIRPGVLCPETVLVARMTDGSYLLMAYPQSEPAAFIARENADVLRQALQGAFGSPVAEVSGNTRRYHP